MTRRRRALVGGGLIALATVTVAVVLASKGPEDSPGRRTSRSTAQPADTSTPTTVALETEGCPGPATPVPGGAASRSPPSDRTPLREALLFEFPDQFGGMYSNPDGSQTVLHVGDPDVLEDFMRQRGVLSGPLALRVTYREVTVTLAELFRCKVMLEQDPVLAPGVVVEGVGVRDSDSSLTVSASGDPVIAERALRARLGPRIAFRLFGPLIEQ